MRGGRVEQVNAKREGGEEVRDFTRNFGKKTLDSQPTYVSINGVCIILQWSVSTKNIPRDWFLVRFRYIAHRKSNTLRVLFWLCYHLTGIMILARLLLLFFLLRTSSPLRYALIYYTPFFFLFSPSSFCLILFSFVYYINLYCIVTFSYTTLYLSFWSFYQFVFHFLYPIHCTGCYNLIKEKYIRLYNLHLLHSR